MTTETRTWTNPITAATETVEKGSIRDMQLMDKMHNAGIWANDDPGKPEGCISMDEYIANQLSHEERYQQYLKRR